MTIERYIPRNREEWLNLRHADVTASDMGTLFGCHPFKTALGLYIEKTSPLQDDTDNAVMRRGRILEDAVARAVNEEHPTWEILKNLFYFRDSRNRIGCTPDFTISETKLGAERKGILQAKTVSRDVFRKHWGDTPPLHIVLQNATELMVTGIEWGVIAVLIIDPYRLDLHLYDMQRNEAVESKIKAAVAKFWTSTDAQTMPSPDFERDATSMSLLYPVETPGKTIDLSSENMLPLMLTERQMLRDAANAAEKRIDAIDTEIKDKMRDAEVGTLEGWRITWKMREGFTSVVKPSRILRVKEQRKHDREN